MQPTPIACVIGGSGFIGRYIVKRLATRGYIVRVAVRDPEAAQFLKPMGTIGQIVPLYAPITDPDHLTRAIKGADVVINLVGILAESHKGDFQRLQAEATGQAAEIAAKSGVKHYIHVSALGADAASDSCYAKSKAEGEARVRAAFPTATILRPSIVFGPEDQFFNRFAAFATISPVLPLIKGATKFQPVFVGDVADAALAAIQSPKAEGQTYELTGPDTLTFKEILQYILTTTGHPRKLLALPSAIATLIAKMPFSGLTTDQLKLLAHDNIASGTHPGLTDLGITPTKIALIVPAYLARFRKGGLRAKQQTKTVPTY